MPGRSAAASVSSSREYSLRRVSSSSCTASSGEKSGKCSRVLKRDLRPGLAAMSASICGTDKGAQGQRTSLTARAAFVLSDTG